MVKSRGQYTERVVVNFLPVHRQAIKRKAQALGMSESTFIRWLLTQQVAVDERELVVLDN